MPDKGLSIKKQGLSAKLKTVKLLSFFISFAVFFLCFLGLGVENKAHAATYYVDNSITDTNPASATPDCTNYNTGTFTCSGGAGSAYKTIADVNAKSFSSDDQILFRKGQTWREQLTVPSSGTSGHPITFGAFGSGANPIISGADLIPPGSSWSLYSGNTWQATLTTQPSQIFFDGTRGTLETAIGNINAQYEWYWASNVLYIYSTSDPDTAYTSPGIEASVRTNNLNLNARNYLSFGSLSLTKANENGVFFSGGTSDHVTLDSLSVSYAFQNGVRSYTGSPGTNVVISNSSISWNGSSGIFVGKGSHDWAIQRDTVFRNSHYADDVGDHNYTSGIHAWCDDGSITNLLIEDNNVYDNGLLADSSRISGSRGMGIWTDTVTLSGYTPYVIIRRNQVLDNNYAGIHVEHGTYHQVYYNVVTGTVNGDGIRISDYSHESGWSVAYNLVYNNTIYNNNWTGLYFTGANGGSAGTCLNNVAKNNIAFNNGRNLKATWGCENDGTNGSGNVFTYNALGAEGGNIIEWGAGNNYTTYAAWEAVYGSTTHSVAGDPLFVGGGEAMPYPYFYPRSYSPVINAGTNVSLTSDYLGVSVPQGAAPDIGAFEYTVSIPENIWFFFPLFLALPRLIFILQNKKDRKYFLNLLKTRRYKAIVTELYSPYLNLFSQLIKRADK